MTTVRNPRVASRVWRVVGVVEGIMATKRDWRFGRFRGEAGHKRLWRDFSMARACLIVPVGLALTLAVWWLPRLGGSAARDPIRVGVLHSFSGTMAISERSVAEATLLAIEEINASGGAAGESIEPVVADGQSDAPTFAAEAQRLIAEAQVHVIFGCWTSASRKSVKPVVEDSPPSALLPRAIRGVGGLAAYRLHRVGAEPADPARSQVGL